METQPSQPNKLPSAMPRYDLQSMVEVLGSLGINITIKELNKPTVINFSFFFILIFEH